MGKTSSAVKQRYNEKAYDRIALNVKKGQRDIVKVYAENQGKSLNAYIVELIEKDMQRSESGSAAAAQLPKEKQAP